MFAISCEIDGRVPMNLYLFLEKARSTPHLLYVHKKWRVCGITHTFQANGKSLASSPAPEVRRFGNTWIAQSIVPKRPSKLYPKGPVHCTQKAHLLYPNGFVPKWLCSQKAQTRIFVCVPIDQHDLRPDLGLNLN